MMKSIKKAVFLVISIFAIYIFPLFISAQPNIDMELATKYTCTVCHKVEEKLIGPSYLEVYEKYKDDEKAEDYLVDKVINGGSGVWGQMPMIPNSSVPIEDVRKLVSQILGKD